MSWSYNNPLSIVSILKFIHAFALQVFSIDMMVISDSILLYYLPWEQKVPFTCWAQMKSRKLSIWPQTLKSLKQTWYMLLTMSLEDPMVSI